MARDDVFTDSNWQVNGTITVTHPNDWETVTLTGVSDTNDNGGHCKVVSGKPKASLPPGGSTALGYHCAFTGNPGSGTNTATATWNGAAAFTPVSSTVGTANYTCGAPTTTVNQKITVTDTFSGTTTTSPPTTRAHNISGTASWGAGHDGLVA